MGRILRNEHTGRMKIVMDNNCTRVIVNGCWNSVNIHFPKTPLHELTKYHNRQIQDTRPNSRISPAVIPILWQNRLETRGKLVDSLSSWNCPSHFSTCTPPTVTYDVFHCPRHPSAYPSDVIVPFKISLTEAQTEIPRWTEGKVDIVAQSEGRACVRNFARRTF